MANEQMQKLKEAAQNCHGWAWPDRRRDENGTHHFGKRTEDGEFYDVGTIDCWTYTSEYADDLRVLKFLRLAQPAKIEALIAKVESLAADAERWKKFERVLRTGRIPGIGHGQRFKIIEICPMYGDEKEFNDFIGAINAMAKEKA